ncbi:tricarballylate utilization 4Fe-4S protein TcuB [Nitratireductor indicus]|uniref:tricarballylate utilization 4Fe-4S protein TcuB n=1 Tax=Nitratireductor indicus TaxID=721133 RepID=UPI002876CD35|nr:tricarballylate utilization 4Fe-4S protein TcuB [Nitratireductor indicus]MDS1136199.1 tricarballylate utilization 4Fe-4S protein TcuB [Nitratireductor indicus]
MSLDQLDAKPLGPAMAEAHRQLEICNACRYCEGFCSVFPAMMRQKTFAEGDLNHMANLCHNCRGCYYSCQYTPPHEFELNLPAILAEVRQESWESYIRPRALSKAFHEHGFAMALAAAIFIGILFWVASTAGADPSAGFYAHLAHNLMVAIFAPAFLAPLAIIALGLRDYWRDTGGRCPSIADLKSAFGSVSKMKNLSGGHGEGCNFEREDRYTNARRYAHQAVLWGFLLCFLSTSSATLMHYFMNWPAPYGLLTPPKLFGLSGGVLLTLGAIEMIRLKLKADPELSAKRVWRGEFAFTALLGLTALSGLLLYVATGTAAVRPLLAFHLGCVLTLFLMMPYTKMVHGFFRLSALIIEAQKSGGK